MPERLCSHYIRADRPDELCERPTQRAFASTPTYGVCPVGHVTVIKVEVTA